MSFLINAKIINILKITFLGTGTSQGVPVIGCNCETCQSKDPNDNRLRSSVLIETKEFTLTIDAGPDFRQQMLLNKISHLDAILVTHGHKDHVGGLDDVRAFNFLSKKPMDVFLGKFAEPDLIREFHYAFEEDRYPGSPNIKLNIIENSPFHFNGIEIIPIKAQHYKSEVFGYRIGDFCYLTDLKTICEEEMNKMRGAKIITISGLRKKEHISHLNLSQAVSLIQELNPEKGYITHISHLMGLHKKVNQELPENISLAYDGLTFICN